MQFLECVAFVLRQFPRAFQFNERLLVFVADASSSALFGTFLGDSERSRKWEMRASKRTVSLWTYVLNAPHSAHFQSRDYAEYRAPLWPHVSPKRATVWDRYYSRWDPAMHPSTSLLCAHDWADDYGDARAQCHDQAAQRDTHYDDDNNNSARDARDDHDHDAPTDDDDDDDDCDENNNAHFTRRNSSRDTTHPNPPRTNASGDSPGYDKECYL